MTVLTALHAALTNATNDIALTTHLQLHNFYGSNAKAFFLSTVDTLRM
jgi:hypothetical protein